MKLQQALATSPRLRTAINRSGDHMVQVVEEVDEMAGRRETMHVVYAVGNLYTGQFERMYRSRRGVRDVEEFLRKSDNKPRIDDLDGDAWVAVD
jgi:hypothetical protein